MKELEDALEQEREAHSRVRDRLNMYAYLRHSYSWQLLLLLLLQTVAEATLALLIYALQTEIVAYYATSVITPALNSSFDSIHPECVCLPYKLLLGAY